MSDPQEIIGTPSNPLRVMVADNWGADAHQRLKDKYPNCVFHVHTQTHSTHPHGHMVAECLLDMLPEDVHVHLTFYPYLALQGGHPDGWAEEIQRAREAGEPYHAVNCSFGIDDFDDPRFADRLRKEWKQPAMLQKYKDYLGDTLVVFAAGNSDQSQRGRPELDNDVNYPQAALCALPNVFVIGACSNTGVPSLFSSDGKEVLAMYWGEAVPVFDPMKGTNTYVDGTSFAAPFACGDIVSYMTAKGSVNQAQYIAYVLSKGWLAEGWERGTRHRKAGYGCMLGVQRARMRPPKVKRITKPTQVKNVQASYLDFTPV